LYKKQIENDYFAPYSDSLNAITGKYSFGVKHSDSYYAKNEIKRNLEVFVNMGEVEGIGDKVANKVMQKMLLDSWAETNNILDEFLE